MIANYLSHSFLYAQGIRFASSAYWGQAVQQLHANGHLHPNPSIAIYCDCNILLEPAEEDSDDSVASVRFECTSDPFFVTLTRQYLFRQRSRNNGKEDRHPPR
jgi:hypothetical protein